MTLELLTPAYTGLWHSGCAACALQDRGIPISGETRPTSRMGFRRKVGIPCRASQTRPRKWAEDPWNTRLSRPEAASGVWGVVPPQRTKAGNVAIDNRTRISGPPRRGGERGGPHGPALGG